MPQFNLSHRHKRHASWLAAIILAPIAVLWSWNTFMPDIFGLAEIKFKQALALTLLSLIASGVLFGGRGRRHMPPSQTKDSE